MPSPKPRLAPVTTTLCTDARQLAGGSDADGRHEADCRRDLKGRQDATTRLPTCCHCATLAARHRGHQLQPHPVKRLMEIVDVLDSDAHADHFGVHTRLTLFRAGI